MYRPFEFYKMFLKTGTKVLQTHFTCLFNCFLIAASFGEEEKGAHFVHAYKVLNVLKLHNYKHPKPASAQTI